MREIRIYFEGSKELKRGFATFFQKAIGIVTNLRITTIAGEGHAVRDFLKAIRDPRHQEAVILLLIDSEGPDDGNLLNNLYARHDWHLQQGCAVSSEQIHWMVQVMESWFLADRNALQGYYGNNFRGGSLPRNNNVEEILKSDVLTGLKRATEHTTKGTYHKTRHAPALLEIIDPQVVRNASPACNRLVSLLLTG